MNDNGEHAGRITSVRWPEVRYDSPRSTTCVIRRLGAGLWDSFQELRNQRGYSARPAEHFAAWRLSSVYVLAGTANPADKTTERKSPRESIRYGYESLSVMPFRCPISFNWFGRIEISKEV